jgi:hypothetical protein
MLAEIIHHSKKHLRRSRVAPFHRIEVKPDIKVSPKSNAKTKVKLPLEVLDPKIFEPKKKEWPANDKGLLDYEDLIWPLKSIIIQGYRLFRKDKKEFNYDGYDIGPEELVHSPPPKYRFTEALLEQDNKRNRKLIDVVLNVAFLLGVEQGRRAERQDRKPMEAIIQSMDKYREENKSLRLKLDESEITLEVKDANPSISERELAQAVSDGIKARRVARIKEARKELAIDPTRSAFDFDTPKRMKFKDLESLARSIDRKKCNEQQWESLLKDRGWTLREWKAKCKKKFITTLDFA